MPTILFDGTTYTAPDPSSGTPIILSDIGFLGPLLAPTGLGITKGIGSLNLAWTDPNTSEKRYLVERRKA